MPLISRGFHGRRNEAAEAARVPPGQYVTPDFPVLSAGPTPHALLESWSFDVRGEVDEQRSWTWEQFTALPSARVTVDIHCVTRSLEDGYPDGSSGCGRGSRLGSGASRRR
jgi:DMSO/TMAO reductase YedYZ molybdopterin-dependent catalytic subunit